MPLLRRLVVLLAVGLGAAVLTGPAFGARATPMEMPNSVGTTHFLVHFAGGVIVQKQAGDVGAWAERAYAVYLADGYPAPPSDAGLGGDNRTDIYVGPIGGGILGVTEWDGGPPSSSGYFWVDSDAGLDSHTVAHELFHVFQIGMWLSPNPSDYWLYEGTAEWMGYRANNYNYDAGQAGFTLGPPDMSLDCRDPFGGTLCDLDPYLDGGYSRWPFFEYVAENYGFKWVKDVFQQGLAGAPTATAALANALAAKGTTLADVYNNWIGAEVRGGYNVPNLQGLDPQPYGLPIATALDPVTGDPIESTPAGPVTFLDTKVTVNHLATRYLELVRGDGDGKHACFASTLALTVTIPAGTQSKPVFYWNEKGSQPVPLSVSGTTATASIPWDTCLWTGNAGFLAIPNASTNVDAADFLVKATLSIDQTRPANSVAPPKPVVVNTPVVQAGSADVAPAISIFGPELLKLAAGDNQIRLIVESSGEGLLQATLGSTALGTSAIRGGNNDVRFTLPASLLASLRTSASTAGVLTLTPVSTNNSATGAAVTQKIQLAAAKVSAKPKAKAKAKPKAKPKTKPKPRRK